MVAAPHQGQFHVILHVFDVERASARTRAHQRAHDRLRQGVNRFAHTGRGGALGAVHRQEGLHHGDSDLAGLERHHRAVAPDDLVLGVDRLGRIGLRRRVTVQQGCRDGGGGGRGGQHVSSVCLWWQGMFSGGRWGAKRAICQRQCC